jgi:hypothetical protein
LVILFVLVAGLVSWCGFGRIRLESYCLDGCVGFDEQLFAAEEKEHRFVTRVLVLVGTLRSSVLTGVIYGENIAQYWCFQHLRVL